MPQIDPEGWYIDDLMIGSTGGLCDFGDAPDDAANPSGYATLLANNGARHGALPGYHLGAAIDIEADGQPTPMADGDDNNPSAGPDDEDGVTFISIDPARIDTVLFVGQQGQATVELTNTLMSTAFLDAWIDFDSNGIWTDSERIATGLSLTAGMNTLTFLVPGGAQLGETFARFRLSSSGGLSPVGPANDGEVEDYQVSIEPWQPAIEIVKTGVWTNTNNDGRADVADTIEYAFTVSNTGNVTLLNVSVTDPMVTVSALGGLTDADQDGLQDDLLPGVTATATGSYQLTQADVDSRMKMNTASANATAPNGDPIRDDDTASVLLPSIRIIKTNASPGGWNDANGNGQPDVGETIGYEFKVTNDGKLPLVNVALLDPTVTVSTLSGLTDADQDGAQDDLLPGAMATATGSYVITQADIDAGQIVNTAAASAADPDGNLVNDDDTVTTDLRSPSIEIVKTGAWTDANNNGRPDVADTIEYSFMVTNTGNVPLLNVTITDPMVTVSALSGLTDADQDGVQDDLLPAAIATATGSYQLTQADVDARMKVNTASANATAPNGAAVRDEATANVLLPSIDIVKTNTSPGGWNDANNNGIPEVGETISYSFTITNDGKLPLLNVSLSDPTVTVSALSGLTDA
ncbi:MAG: hypothetical protein HYV60_13350, partial [Planctomycetia bacterium]|nr:hypothetical protein [Planctomycetia bacterium]